MRNLPAAAAVAVFALATTPAFAQTAQGEASGAAAAQSKDMQGQASDATNFATNAAQNGVAEIVLSSLALQKSDNQRIIDFSAMMIDHHSSAMIDLMKALNEGEMTVPIMPGAEQMQAIERLRGLSGEQFEQAYFQHQVEAHQKAVSVFEQGAEAARSEDLARFAEMKLPLLRAHLELAEKNAKAGSN